MSLGGFQDCMVDLETGGLSPDRSPIIQIGAVRFNKEHLTIDQGDIFNRCMRVPPTRHWDEGTKEWWSQQNQDVFNSIQERAEDPAVVMKAFFDWATTWPSPKFWAKPTSFDFPFVQSYFKDYDYPMPFHYRTATDIRSFVEGLHYPNPIPEVPRTDLGDAHDAVVDCLMQIEHLFHHVELRRKANASNVA